MQIQFALLTQTRNMELKPISNTELLTSIRNLIEIWHGIDTDCCVFCCRCCYSGDNVSSLGRFFFGLCPLKSSFYKWVYAYLINNTHTLTYNVRVVRCGIIRGSQALVFAHTFPLSIFSKLIPHVYTHRKKGTKVPFLQKSACIHIYHGLNYENQDKITKIEISCKHVRAWLDENFGLFHFILSLFFSFLLCAVLCREFVRLKIRMRISCHAYSFIRCMWMWMQTFTTSFRSFRSYTPFHFVIFAVCFTLFSPSRSLATSPIRGLPIKSKN